MLLLIILILLHTYVLILCDLLLCSVVFTLITSARVSCKITTKITSPGKLIKRHGKIGGEISLVITVKTIKLADDN